MRLEPQVLSLLIHLVRNRDHMVTKDEIIEALSRLRWLEVIARGSSLRLQQVAADLDLVSMALMARYVLSGNIESPDLVAPVDEIGDLRARIVAHLVAALESHIPFNEARLARLIDPAQLDPWAHYHIGLGHLYRFTAADTALAKVCFEQAVRADPQFARAHAGLSFTSFLDAFLRLTPDPASASRNARRHAERSLEIDARDPFANFTMGRSFWLTDEPEVAADWLARATALNPNYAQGFYAAAFTEMLTGNAAATLAALDTALHLSPLDPLLHAIPGVRAQMLFQQEDDQAAARRADRSHDARGPLSHRHDRARGKRARRPARPGCPLAPEGPPAQAGRHSGKLFCGLSDARLAFPCAHRDGTGSAWLLIPSTEA